MRRPLALALLLAATPALAQQEACSVADAPCATQLELVLRPDSEPLRPGDETTLAIEVRYTFFQAAPTPRPTRVDIEVADAPEWAAARVEPSTVVFSSGVGCACSRTETARTFLFLRAGPEAPAFTEGTVAVAGEARENGAYRASSATAEVPVVAGFFGLTRASVERDEVELTPHATAALPMELRNEGNGPVRLGFSVESAPRGVRVIPPPPLLLDAEATGGRDLDGSVTWTFEAGRAFDEGQAVLLVESVYARDATLRGDEVRVPVDVKKGAVEVSTALGAGGGATSPLGMGILAMAAGLGIYYDRKRKGAQ